MNPLFKFMPGDLVQAPHMGDIIGTVTSSDWEDPDFQLEEGEWATVEVLWPEPNDDGDTSECMGQNEEDLRGANPDGLRPAGYIF